MKKFYKHLLANAIIFGIIFSWISCATTKIGKNKPLVPDAMGTMYIPIIKTVSIVKHDTVRVKRRLNDSLIQSVYKLNYDRYFAPEFSKLIGNNKALVDIIKSMRTRSIIHNDSMQRQMSFYIKEANASENQSIKYQEEALKAARLYDQNIQDQVKSNNRVSIICITGIIILFVFLLGLFLYCRSEFDRVKKQIANA